MPCLLQGAVCDAPMEDSTAVPGAGLLALVDGRRLAAGTAALLAQHVGVEGPRGGGRTGGD